jgi:hypothetical protein
MQEGDNIMTKALIPKQGSNLANRTLKAGWPAPAGRAVAAYGRAVAQQAAAGRGLNGRVRSPYRTSGAMQPPPARWLCRLCRKCDGQGVDHSLAVSHPNKTKVTSKQDHLQNQRAADFECR